MAQQAELLFSCLNLELLSHATGLHIVSVLFEAINMVGKLILGAKTKCFFGKIMLPEFTCGKLILPFHPQFMIFGDWL